MKIIYYSYLFASKELSNNKLIQLLPIPKKSIYTYVYHSHLIEKMKNANALSLVELFGSIGGVHGCPGIWEREEEDNSGGWEFNDLLFIFRREFNDLIIYNLTWH